jgi:phage-related protein
MSYSSLYFIYDNEQNIDYGVYIVHLESGFYPTPVGGSKNIISDKIAYRDLSYHYRTELEPLKFSITLAPLDDTWTETTKFNLFKWLGNRTYKSFQTCDDLSKMCYCICTNPQEISSVGTDGQFYLTLEFEASSPYWFSMPEYSTFDCTAATPTVPITIEIWNKSNVLHPKLNDYYYEPELWIDFGTAITGLTISNTSDGNRQTILTGCVAADSIYLNNSLKQIEATTTTSLLAKFNKNWLRLSYGKNLLTINKACILQFKCQFPLYI